MYRILIDNFVPVSNVGCSIQSKKTLRRLISAHSVLLGIPSLQKYSLMLTLKHGCKISHDIAMLFYLILERLTKMISLLILISPRLLVSIHQ